MIDVFKFILLITITLSSKVYLIKKMVGKLFYDKNAVACDELPV